MIEWRWNLQPLTVRDRTANNLAQELDFGRTQLDASVYSVAAVTGAVCPVNPAFVGSGGGPHWDALGEVALKTGWGI
jgi:hypothetical protein